MTKAILRTLLLLSLSHLALVIGHSSSVLAQNLLQYPIPDLGYCRDAKECSLYCEIPKNKAACWSYGKYKLGPQVLGVSTMSEEEKNAMRQKAKEYGITFPIADLGNCAGPKECRDFCEQTANRQTCMDFAKKKGFQKEMERENGMDRQKQDELLVKAKIELGCTSMESCSKICETDHNRCEAFARKHGVYQEPPQSRGRYSAEEKIKLMENAKTELGCASMESCRSTCEQDPQRCMEFAKKHGLDKGSEQREYHQSGQYQQETQRRVSPNYGTQRLKKDNCDSEESCKKYCQEHPNECPGFQGYTRATQEGAAAEVDGKNYVGPSGCRNEAECKQYCEINPTKCPGFSQSDDYTHFVDEKNRVQSETEQNYRTYGPSPYSTQTQQLNLPESSGTSPYLYPNQPTTSQYSTTNSYPPQGTTSPPPYPSPFTSTP